MKKYINHGILLFFIFALASCSDVNEESILNTEELILNNNDIQEIGLIPYPQNPDLENLDISLGEDGCRTEIYETNRSSLAQDTFCSYKIDELNGTDIIIEIKKFTNLKDLNGSYQYSSSHLQSSKGIISENEFGDQSIFRVNHEDDYMGNLNEEDVYYYHLWIAKDFYLIHVTSGGSEDAKEYISEIGKTILSKFDYES